MSKHNLAQPMRHVRNVHFVGIGGAGMCGIAEVLANLGYVVSGSDLELSPVTERLESIGVSVFPSHERDNVESADVVVVSSAIPSKNVEIVRAHELHKPVVPRAEMLGELMRQRYGIAVAGTHGKTTATSFIAAIFQAADLDPTYVIGGLLRSDNRNARLGTSRYIIAEADESDASFLYLNPMLAVITNIDRDHLGTYDHEFDELRSAFREFVAKLPFYGALIVCIDDEEARALVDEVSRPVITYGFDESADYQAKALNDHGPVWQFAVKRPGELGELQIELTLPGIQNVQNALAAIAVASDEGIEDEYIQEGIRRFGGVGRRFEIGSVTLNEHQLPMVDDYGHHPTEIECTLKTVARVWPARRPLMVYQPHRFTRTLDLYDDFVEVLSHVADLIIMDTYAASERPIEKASARNLCRSISRKSGRSVQFANDAEAAVEALVGLSRGDHVIMIQGAGDVSKVSDLLKTELKQ